ncbi:MAG: hypothetical protein AB7K24_06260 [Gemmataceae bacterium]
MYKVALAVALLFGWAGLAAGAVPDVARPADDKEKEVLADWVLKMVRKGGYGPQGGKTVSEFRVNNEGRFLYDGVSGQMPKKEVDALLKAAANSNRGDAAEDAGSVSFYARGEKGEAVLLVLFTQPASVDCQALLKRLGELAKAHKDKTPAQQEKE